MVGGPGIPGGHAPRALDAAVAPAGVTPATRTPPAESSEKSWPDVERHEVATLDDNAGHQDVAAQSMVSPGPEEPAGFNVLPGKGPADAVVAFASMAPACTAPQLRRFIKSRPYVPMHELRRRFGIIGGEDDVTPVSLGPNRIFVGLPPREGALLGDLLRGGEIGYELSLDPRSPIVIGLYPMRPVARS
jgi:hypothetical protein